MPNQTVENVSILRPADEIARDLVAARAAVEMLADEVATPFDSSGADFVS